ncbi:mechanosensitive ion channel family protein [Desulfopila inferna]|uniref:mechanosensitive ion channel family protein n=1 Tax=Desulfopila inferna TaxID=468528 RepID=UPI00196436A2|nr:mechanosensitive ion channel family protein [Desulfopila inferna]MBM9603703.1 mechanosensitive ion channel family protein [Desulfopila inferna]
MIALQKTWLMFVLIFLGGVHCAAAASTPKELENQVATLLDPLITIFSTNPWVKGAAVVLITFTVASFLTWILFKLLRRICRLTSFDIDDKIILLLRPPVYFTLLATGIYAGIELMPLSEKIDVLLGRFIRTIGVVIWIYFFARLASLVLQRLADLSYKYTFIQHRTLTLFDNAAKIFIFGVGIYAAFVIWKIDMTAWLASAGIAGIAIGFAAKDTLSNLFSGVFILADAPYKVGDYIVLDRGDRGKVMNIGLRSTRILTRDDVEITIPNSIIGNSTIINQSGGRHTKLRLRLKIGVAYGSDIDLVRSILMEIAQKERLVCKSPEARVRFRTFGASSLDFELLAWVDNPELRGQAMDKLNEAIYKKFTEMNIEIPYAKQDLYIKGLPEYLTLRKPEEGARELKNE